MKILARHKGWVAGCTITESHDDEKSTREKSYRRFTATILGWRNFIIYEGFCYVISSSSLRAGRGNAPVWERKQKMEDAQMNLTALQQAVIRQLGHDPAEGTASEELYGTLEDVTQGGADAGWSGFTYYSNTLKFAKKNRKLIESLVRDEASDYGQDPVDMILSFRCLDQTDKTQREAAGRFVYGGHYRDSKNCDSRSVYNALAWFALEETARALTNY